MKKVLFLMLFLTVLEAANVHAQVKVGDNLPPKTGAVLDLKSSFVGGLLLPNVSIVDTATIDFTEVTLWNVDSNHDLTGLIVYNTNEALATGKGIYVWDGEKWLAIQTGSGGGGIVNPGCGTLTIDNQTPAFTTINVNAGDAVTLEVTASITDGTAPIFQWYQNTQAGTTGATPITGSTTPGKSTLTPPTAANTTFYYYCVVTNPCDAQMDLSKNWVVTATQSGPGPTILGWSNNCPYNNKSRCTCTTGTALTWSESSDTQRSSALGSNGSNIGWFWNRQNGDRTVYWSAYLGSTWNIVSTADDGNMACF